MPIEVGLDPLEIIARRISLRGIEPLVDGEVPPHRPPRPEGNSIRWELEDGAAVLHVEQEERPRLRLSLEDISPGRQISSLGLRFGSVEGAGLYLRNGYQSWDGSFLVEPGTPPGDGPPAKAPSLGFAMTALLPQQGGGALVVGFSRHDRFQSRFRFGGTAAAFAFDAETLRDRVSHQGSLEAEPLVFLEHDEVEEALRDWSRLSAAESPHAPRLRKERITGWCSWYNLYAAIDEPSILEHLHAAEAFRDEREVPLEVFLIDDGFTPEMGDWLDVKPQFPRGMKPLISDIAAAGFTPGLWIAPFLVGNRSRLYAEHPDWVVESVSGGPLRHMKFYGEFRWHKRSEEYYVLDVTRPDAADYVRNVFRTWRHDWGAGYFKTDFMNAGMEYGPDQAKWHEQGLSRVEIWRRMAAIIRDEIGDALWLGSGSPLWASIGYVDAVRIGRDIGVSWHGDYSAESLLRDQVTRNHASHILWQADPDCVLLRERFHELSDDELRSLLLFAGLSGGVLMTSDKLDEVPAARAELFASLLAQRDLKCDFPEIGRPDGLIIQRVTREDGIACYNIFNPTRSVVALRRPDGSSGSVEVEPHASIFLR
ncbi:MAG: glycoside hydrolase family 36 protein [Sphingomicrobium sp.]